LMSVRLERNIGRAATSFIAGLFQGDSFGVLDMVVEIKTFANILAVRINDDGADQRSRADLANALRGKIKGSLHHLSVQIGELFHAFVAPQSGEVFIALRIQKR